MALNTFLIFAASSTAILLGWKYYELERTLPANTNNNLYSYGVDTTFQIHGNLDMTTPRASHYDEFLQGCVKRYSSEECRRSEKNRVASNLFQPRNLQNYTTYGYRKLSVPPKAWEIISSVYERNKHIEHKEKWAADNIAFVNHWESPTYLIYADNNTRINDNKVWIRQAIMDALLPAVEAWAGISLVGSSMHGIRVYKKHSMLATHVDKGALIVSCIINVDQDVDEDWPLEVYDHQGWAQNITLKPGQMLMYESGTVLHGRPFPLKGNSYVNLFVNFHPPISRVSINEDEGDTSTNNDAGEEKDRKQEL